MNGIKKTGFHKVHHFLIIWRCFLFARLHQALHLKKKALWLWSNIFQCGGDARECAHKCLLMYTKCALSRRARRLLCDGYVCSLWSVQSAIFSLLPGRRESTPRALCWSWMSLSMAARRAVISPKRGNGRVILLLWTQKHWRLSYHHLFHSNQSTESKRTFFWQCTFLAALSTS